MIKKPTIITGLDIGSSKISAVALEVFPGGISTLRAYESYPSKGILRGVITDMSEASSSVSRVLAGIARKTLKGPENIYANITGESIKAERSRGMIPLSSRGREVTKSDMARCVNAAGTIRLAFDRDIIHRIALNFSIDNQPAIKSALGLYASRLSCEMYVITASLNQIQNIYKCVNNAGYDLKEVIYSGIADGISILDEQCKTDGVALLNIGASLSELSIYFAGALNFIDIIQAGAGDMKTDLREAAVFNDTALRIKSCIEDFTRKGGSVKALVLTGGFSFTEGAAEMLEEKLSLPVKMGVVRNVHGNISSQDSLKCVTAIGLARYAAAQYQPRIAQAKNLVHDISERVVDIFNNYF